MKSPILKTSRLELRQLDPDGSISVYCGWLNDPDVNKFLEVRLFSQTEENVRTFVRNMNESKNNALFGIYLTESGRHIGNIKLGPIHSYHARADIGLLLGDRSQWGKGFATESIEAITAYAFTTLNLNKVNAGCYAANEGSLRAFLKAGFREVGRRRNHTRSTQGWMDDVLMERNNPNPPPL